MSFSICMKWGSFQGHKSSFWTFLPCLVPHAFIGANVLFSLKWSQIDLNGQFRLFDSDLQWHCHVFGVCCAGVLPAKQITQHDSSLLYSAELLFVVVVVCFYFFFVEAEKGTFVVQLVTCMQHSRFSPTCFQTCKLRSPSVWVYGNEMQKHFSLIFFLSWSKRWNNWNNETKFERNTPFLSNFEDKKYFLRSTRQVLCIRKPIKQHDCRTSVVWTGHSEKQLSDICHKCCEFWVCVQLTRWLQHCPPDLLPVNWMLHFPIVSLLQRCLSIWQYFQPPSRPHTTYNHASLGLYHIQLHHLQGCVRQATWTAESIFLLAFFSPAFK